MALPPVLPDTALRLSTRLARDHWVRVGTCDYSVHPKVIGRMVRGPGHPRRGGRHLWRPRWSAATFVRGPNTAPSPTPITIGPATACAQPASVCRRHRSQDEVEVRDLSVYDRATGVA